MGKAKKPAKENGKNGKKVATANGKGDTMKKQAV